MPEVVRKPQAGTARFGSSGVAGAGAGSVAVLLGAGTGVTETVAIALAPIVGFIVGGFLGSLGKFARDKATAATEAGKVSPWSLISWVG
jgi:hypothetical protein